MNARAHTSPTAALTELRSSVRAENRCEVVAEFEGVFLVTFGARELIGCRKNAAATDQTPNAQHETSEPFPV